LEEVWREFQNAGFEPILIKGWAAARLYPKPFRRQYVDIDLAIAPRKYEEAVAFSRASRFSAAIDLHKGLRHLDTLDFEDLFSNSVLKKCGDTNIRILREEDHLRVLSVHWLNDGGAYKEKLWDIYHAVANRSASFDWERCLMSVNPKRRRWIACAIGLAHLYLGLEIGDTPVAREAKDIPRWLVKAVEKEWKDEVKLTEFYFSQYKRPEFWQQLRKRLRPNPIQATIELEGKFDETPRFFYQCANVLTRSVASVKKRFGQQKF